MKMQSMSLLILMLTLTTDVDRCKVDAKCVSVTEDLDVDIVESKRKTTTPPRIPCPENCTCKQHVVSCVRKELRSVPDNIPSDVSTLIISGNVIERLTVNDFLGCLSLTELRLDLNRIELIENNTFVSTPRLKRLVLRMNRLRYSSLPANAFAGLKRLTYLDISYNFGNESLHYNGPLFGHLTGLYSLLIDGIRGAVFPGEMSRLRQLRDLRIFGELDSITNETFAELNNSSVSKLSIHAYDYLQTLEPESFMYFTHLEELKLSNNHMLGLVNASRAWYGLQFTKIKTLELSAVTPDDQNSVVIDSDFFNFLAMTKMKTLLINSNYITRIEPRFSLSLPYLIKLNMNGNRLNSDIDRLIDDIANMTNLQMLLADRQLPSSTLFGISSFRRRERLVADDETSITIEQPVLDVSELSQIPQCPSRAWQHCPQAYTSSFSSITQLKVNTDKLARKHIIQPNPICFAIPPKLSIVTLDESIAIASHTLPQVVIRGGQNLERLSLAVNGLQRIEGPIYFKEPVTNLSVDFTDNQIHCMTPHLFRQSALSGSYIGELKLAGNRLADQLNVDEKGEIFQYYGRLSVLILSRNSIKRLPRRTFENLTDLRILDLSINSLRLIEFKFNHMFHLQVLDLSDNLIVSLNESLRLTFSTMFKVNGSKLKLNLNGNPLQCSCQTLDFLRWVESNKQRMDSFDNYTCLYSNNYVAFSRLADLILVDLDYECSTRTAVVVAGSLLGLVLCLMTASTCCYRHRWEIRYYCLKWTRQGQRYQQIVDLPVQYEYDAFVIYDSEDRNWVNDELVPRLEEHHLTDLDDIAEPSDDSVRDGPTCNRLRLCVHERDFPPGHEIIGNIWNKMERSRKVILVISRNFTESYYCDYEMNLARMQSVEQGRNLIVPILLALPDINKVSECLHWILSKLTYLEWPQHEGEQEEFWRRLQNVLSGDSGDNFFSHRAVN